MEIRVRWELNPVSAICLTVRVDSELWCQRKISTPVTSARISVGNVVSVLETEFRGTRLQCFVAAGLASSSTLVTGEVIAHHSGTPLQSFHAHSTYAHQLQARYVRSRRTRRGNGVLRGRGVRRKCSVLRSTFDSTPRQKNGTLHSIRTPTTMLLLSPV